MTVTINLPPDLDNALRQQAARSGQEVSAFVVDAVKEKIAKGRTVTSIGFAPEAKRLMPKAAESTRWASRRSI